MPDTTDASRASSAPLSHRPTSTASRFFGNAYLLLTLTTLFWAGNAVVGRGISGEIPPIALAWLRWTLATLIILPFAWPHLRRDIPLILAHWKTLLGLGVLGPGAFNTLYYIGLSKTSALNGLIINSVVPLLVPVATYAVYRTRLSALQAAGVVLSLTGVVIILTKGDIIQLAALNLNEGALWVLAAVVCWSVYTTVLRERPTIHWKSFATLTFAVAAVANFPLFLAEHWFSRQMTLTTESLLAILYVSTLPSVAAYIFYTRGVHLIGSNRAGVFLHLVPLFGAVLAIVFLGEALRLFHFGGFAFIIAGVALASRPAASR
ncbi:MAG: DMT family transporter [Alphaproteobacteria bacterium]